MKTLLALSAIALFAAACEDDPTVNPTPDFAMQVLVDMAMHTTGDAAINASVDINDNNYAPRNVTISAGGMVTWTWRGSSSHSATSDDGVSFDSPIQSSGTFMHNFTAAGSFPYHCRIHGALMTGTITVQ